MEALELCSGRVELRENYALNNNEQTFIVRIREMTLTQLREKITSKCPYYRGGADHRCNERLERICFLFGDDGLPEYCKHFEKTSDIPIAELDRIWKRFKKKKGEKEILKKAIISHLLENGEMTQKDMIRQNLISERKLKYHWTKLMRELSLKWKRGKGENYRYKIYTATYRKKRELKRILRELNRVNAKEKLVYQHQTT